LDVTPEFDYGFDILGSAAVLLDIRIIPHPSSNGTPVLGVDFVTSDRLA
jgi:hypothetical protein